MAIDRYSVAAFPIHPCIKGEENGHATGCFYRKDGRLFLVTNWHCLSGRDAGNGQCISPKGIGPDSIGIVFHMARLGDWSNPVFFDLVNEEGEVFWKQHATYGQDVDVAVLEIMVPEGASVYPINELPAVDDIVIEIGMDLFVLGFPISTFSGVFPIWKRATLATEFDFSRGSPPKFLIDTATRSGMSGAPVILRQRGPYTNLNGESVMQVSLPATVFLGIYSGRYGGDNLQLAQLGIVWSKKVIDEIIDDGVPGSYILR